MDPAGPGQQGDAGGVPTLRADRSAHGRIDRRAAYQQHADGLRAGRRDSRARALTQQHSAVSFRVQAV